MSLLDRLGETQLGLGGVRPANLPSSKNTSKTHATDPVHGKRGDEKVSFNSESVSYTHLTLPTILLV